MENRNIQRPATNPNQIETERPSVKRSFNSLAGYIANSMNAGHHKVIAWKQIMPGERHQAYRLKMNMQMLTPLTPAYQNLTCKIQAIFVPDSRVWTNAEKFEAQRGGASETKIEKVPTIVNRNIGLVQSSEEDGKYGLFNNTAAWRDSFISSYIPRVGMLKEWDNPSSTSDYDKPFRQIPEISVLPLRGIKAIYNDILRNKEYQEERQEYKGDTVSDTEWLSYLPDGQDMDYYTLRARRDNSYYTDYWTELQGFELGYPPEDMSADTALLNWASWESKIAEARAQAENAQKNPWDIISEIRGSKKLTEGKVQVLATKTFPLNYSAITQNAYNNNEQIREDFRVLGKQGAYSYTEIDMALYTGVEFIESGYVHIIATVTADSVFETGFDRLELNVKAMDRYRPDMASDKKDVLYDIEKTSNYNSVADAYNFDTRVTGFKRRYNEYFKLPTIVSGDMTSKGYYDYYSESDIGMQKIEAGTIVIPNDTYQFFEESDRYTKDGDRKEIWFDYSDLLVNKNQAVMNQVYQDPESKGLVVGGQNQIFFVGLCQCIADLPIEEEVKNNFLKWTEH